jgi:hypothetical protein
MGDLFFSEALSREPAADIVLIDALLSAGKKLDDHLCSRGKGFG